jgi:hypothetical protein
MIDEPKSIRPLSLDPLGEEMRGLVVLIWENPPVEEFLGFWNNRHLLCNEQVEEYLSRLWSQGSDPQKRFMPWDVKNVREALQESAPGVWEWLISATATRILAFYEGDLYAGLFSTN